MVEPLTHKEKGLDSALREEVMAVATTPPSRWILPGTLLMMNKASRNGSEKSNQ
jgi:hypothetical protein